MQVESYSAGRAGGHAQPALCYSVFLLNLGELENPALPPPFNLASFSYLLRSF